MKLPNGAQAIVELRKLQEYCLRVDHPRGRNKARVFASAGIRHADAARLRDALAQAAIEGEATQGPDSLFGRRYVIDFDFAGIDRAVRVRSA